MSPRWPASGSAVGWHKPPDCGTAQARDEGLGSSDCFPRGCSFCWALGTSLLLRQHGCCSVPETGLRLPEMSSCSRAVWTWRSFSSCSAPIMQFICSCSPSPTSFMDSCGGKQGQSQCCQERARKPRPKGRRAGLSSLLKHHLFLPTTFEMHPTCTTSISWNNN